MHSSFLNGYTVWCEDAGQESQGVTVILYQASYSLYRVLGLRASSEI